MFYILDLVLIDVIFFFFWLFVLKIGSHYVVPAGLKITESYLPLTLESFVCGMRHTCCFLLRNSYFVALKGICCKLLLLVIEKQWPKKAWDPCLTVESSSGSWSSQLLERVARGALSKSWSQGCVCNSPETARTSTHYITSYSSKCESWWVRFDFIDHFILFSLFPM